MLPSEISDFLVINEVSFKGGEGGVRIIPKKLTLLCGRAMDRSEPRISVGQEKQQSVPFAASRSKDR